MGEIRADEASHRDAYRAALDAFTSGKGDRAVPEGPMPEPADRSAVPASAESKQNLLSAMRGEAFAHAKYLLYADHARRSGHSRLAHLFAQTAVYPQFADPAQAAGDREAADRFREIAQDESRHRDLFSLALQKSEPRI